MILSTLGVSSGKWYWEVTPTSPLRWLHDCASDQQLLTLKMHYLLSSTDAVLHISSTGTTNILVSLHLMELPLLLAM
jgi:hypothetical protein